MKTSASISSGQILTGPLFAERMRAEAVQPYGPVSWVVGLAEVRTKRLRS